LEPQHAVRQVEDEVIARIIERPQNDDPELGGFADDRRLGDHALLVRRQLDHLPRLVAAPDKRLLNGQR
jgi:hypothetical protein